jgi:hypothetical protein
MMEFVYGNPMIANRLFDGDASSPEAAMKYDVVKNKIAYGAEDGVIGMGNFISFDSCIVQIQMLQMHTVISLTLTMVLKICRWWTVDRSP